MPTFVLGKLALVVGATLGRHADLHHERRELLAVLGQHDLGGQSVGSLLLLQLKQVVGVARDGHESVVVLCASC